MEVRGPKVSSYAKRDHVSYCSSAGMTIPIILKTSLSLFCVILKQTFLIFKNLFPALNKSGVYLLYVFVTRLSVISRNIVELS